MSNGPSLQERGTRRLPFPRLFNDEILSHYTWLRLLRVALLAFSGHLIDLTLAGLGEAVG